MAEKVERLIEFPKLRSGDLFSKLKNDTGKRGAVYLAGLLPMLLLNKRDLVFYLVPALFGALSYSVNYLISNAVERIKSGGKIISSESAKYGFAASVLTTVSAVAISYFSGLDFASIFAVGAAGAYASAQAHDNMVYIKDREDGVTVIHYDDIKK